MIPESNHPVQTVTLPVSLYHAMAKVYYAAILGIDRDAVKISGDQGVKAPGSPSDPEVDKKLQEVLLRTYMPGYEPRGAAARARCRTTKPSAAEATDVGRNAD